MVTYSGAVNHILFVQKGSQTVFCITQIGKFERYLIFHPFLFLADFLSIMCMFYSGSPAYLLAYSYALFHRGVHETSHKCWQSLKMICWRTVNSPLSKNMEQNVPVNKAVGVLPQPFPVLLL